MRARGGALPGTPVRVSGEPSGNREDSRKQIQRRPEQILRERLIVYPVPFFTI